MKNQCQVVAVASGFMDDSEKQTLFAPYRKIFSDVEIEEVQDSGDPNRPLIYFACTGGTEREILQLQNVREQAQSVDYPIIIVAHPFNNSLPASLEALARFQQMKKPGRIIYFRSAEDFTALAQLKEFLHFQAVDQVLSSRRIGLIGSPSEWLVASSPSADVLMNVWGPSIIDIELSELISNLQLSDPGDQDPGEYLDAIKELSIEPTQLETDDALDVYAKLTELIKKHSVDAVSLQCFSLVTELKTTGCYALAKLNDQGVVAGCEGDLVATLGLLLVKELLSEVAWMANPAQIDTQTNSLWLAHCTVPCNMIDDYRIRSHFESGLGVAIEGQLRMQPVTLLRIGGTSMDQYWLAEGEIIETGVADSLCRTQARVELSQGHVRELLEHPLGNHLVLVYGQHSETLSKYMAHKQITRIS